MSALRRLLYLGYYFRQLDWAKLDHFMRHTRAESGVSKARQWALIISNSLKYAFPPSRKTQGIITISLHSVQEDRIRLIVQDDGVGLPRDFDIEQSDSLGLKLVKILAEEQLRGELHIENRKGATFTIHFGLS